MAFVIALLVGVLTGYFGAILPGPVNFSVMSKVARNQGRAALLIAVGGASMDAAFCVAVGLGVGWFGALVSQPVVRLILAIFLAGYGVKLAFFDPDPTTPANGVDLGRPGSAAPPASRSSVFVGALQGAANPALIVSWTIIIGFLVAHGMIQANVAGTLGFSIGVALGGMGWFCSLIGLLQHFASSPVIRLWKRSTPLGGGALLALGAWYALKTFHDL